MPKKLGPQCLSRPVLERANKAGRRRPGLTERYSELTERHRHHRRP